MTSRAAAHMMSIIFYRGQNARQRAREIGDQAAALVLRRLMGESGAGSIPFSNVRVDGDLILRDSTGPAPVDAVD